VSAQSPYIHKVYDFRPAPGQYVNELPEYEPGNTREDLIRKAETFIANDERIPVSLGNFGGYIVFGFDHPVMNVPGEYDFKVLGNAVAGSSEPGIVMVAIDVNGNGIPDDEWYELAGSEYNQPSTIKNYRITYYRPDENKTPTPGEVSFLSDTTYLKWNDNQGGQGYVFKNTFHIHSYYPLWEEVDELVFEGSRLADNFIRVSENNYMQTPFDWGYVDNVSNTDSDFDLDWAVDKEGHTIRLSEVHFFKVYTAVNQNCGWIGESSTEIAGAVDLHPAAATAIRPPRSEWIKLLNNPLGNQIRLISPLRQTVGIYTIQGVNLLSFPVENGINTVPCNLSRGIYVLVAGPARIKFVKQ
jgi:hypothetical protein